VEKVESTLPEDLGEMAEELEVNLFDLVFSSLTADLAHELIDVVTDLKRVSPLLHMKTELELILSHFKNEGKLVFLLESDWVGNL